MSSIASFYLLAESQRDSFIEAQYAEKTITLKPRFFGLLGNREVVTGDKYLWEYLDAESVKKSDFPHSGFLITDYFFTYLKLPSDLQEELTESTSTDGHYTFFEHSIAKSLADFLKANKATEIELLEFANDQGMESSTYLPLLRETHSILIDWFNSVSSTHLGVMHLTF